MNSIQPKKRWIELEMSMVDKNWYAIFPKDLWEKSAYEMVIENVQNIKTEVKQEVINNMIEIVTTPRKTIDQAKKDILFAMRACQKTIEKNGMYASQVPWVKAKNESIPMGSIVEYCVTKKDYYYDATREILTQLNNPYDLLWAWCLATHIHVSANDDEETIQLFVAMSNYAAKLRNNWKTPQYMFMNPQRYVQWNKIIEARKKLGHLIGWIDPEIILHKNISDVYDKYFDKDWNLKRMHNIIALKKPWERLTVELRSPDGVIQEKKLSDIIDFTKNFIQNALYENIQK